MSALESKLQNLLKTYGHLTIGKKLIVACSGGADSMALTDLLQKLKEEYKLEIYVLHVQHHLRGKEAERDAQCVEAYCAKKDLNYLRCDVDVKALVKNEGLSVEEAARKLRYLELEKARKKYKATGIYLAHHQDDQAETVVLNLVRGAGNKGLRGMLGENGYLIRPFLQATKKELEQYCKKHKIAYCFDSSNADTKYKRNWVRTEVLPLLEKANPQVKKSLATTAVLAKRDNEALEEMAEKYLKKYEGSKEGQYFIKVKALKKKPLAVQSRVVKLALEKAATANLNFEHIESILELLAKGESGKSLSLPKAEVLYQYDELFINPKKRKQTSKTFVKEIKVPGVVVLSAKKKIKASYVTKISDKEHNVFYYPKELLQGKLLVRQRQAGDKFRPSGTGSKKLKDFLIDQKVPRDKRDDLLVVAEGNEVLWILGLRAAGWKEIIKKQEYLKLTYQEE